MRGLRISDMTERGFLAFDLTDLLDLLGERVAQSDWWCFVEECISAESARPNLEEAYSSPALLTGSELLALASETRQVIDGEFEGFRQGESQPWVTLKAIDSTYWEVFARKAEDLAPFECRFHKVEHIKRGFPQAQQLAVRSPWRAGALLGSAVGLIVAAVIMYIAWEHNAQGEIHSESGIRWGYWLLIGLSWFAPVAASLSLALGGLFACFSRMRGKGVA